MEYPLSEEHVMFRDTMRRFVDEEMIPVEMETIGEDGQLKPEWREKYRAWEFPPKPPGMHWRTYNRHFERWEWYDAASWAMIGSRLKLFG